MNETLLKACLFAACLSLAVSSAQAQERVHALSGTVTAIHPKIFMTDVATDDGSPGAFKWVPKGGPTIDFDKKVSDESTPVEKFDAKGNHVIVFYYESGDQRTAVAVHDLGADAVEKTSGSIVKFSRKEHLLTITSSTGVEVAFTLDPQTVADTASGVALAFKADFNKGDQVRITSRKSGAADTALLIVPVM